MITDLPTANDFYTEGKELIDFAWDTTMGLLTSFEGADWYGFDPAEIHDDYWAAAKRRLTTALALTQQGIELILKGRIADISIYLLVATSPSHWPSAFDSKQNIKNVEFTQLRTIDSQDLVKTIDLFSNAPLDRDFVDKFNELRTKRNIIMHSTSKYITVHVADVVETILLMYKFLLPKESLGSERLAFLSIEPDTHLGSGEWATSRVCAELSMALDLLSEEQVTAVFGIDADEDIYMCPKCLDNKHRHDESTYHLAVLRPNTPDSTLLYCLVCNQTHTVIRQDCEDDECSGTVLCPETELCLTCGN